MAGSLRATQPSPLDTNTITRSACATGPEDTASTPEDTASTPEVTPTPAGPIQPPTRIDTGGGGGPSTSALLLIVLAVVLVAGVAVRLRRS